MKNMFLGAKTFNQPLASWDTSKVKDMKGMFLAARSFNQPLDSWDASKISNSKKPMAPVKTMGAGRPGSSGTVSKASSRSSWEVDDPVEIQLSMPPSAKEDAEAATA